MKDTFFIIIAQNNSQTKENRWYFKQSLSKELEIILKDNFNIDSKPNFVLDGSPFFSYNWYTWLSEDLTTQIKIEVYGNNSFNDANAFAYLTHIGSLLCAVDAKDGLLAAEIFHRRHKIFMKFPQLTLDIIKPIAAEGLFAWIYGSFNYYDEKYLQDVMRGNFLQDKSQWDVTETFFEAAKDRFYPQNIQTTNIIDETPKQMMIRFFQTNKNISLTMPLVGTNFSNWANQSLIYIERRLQNEESKDFARGTKFAKNARQRIFSKTKSHVQTEPSNYFDPNAIAVFLEDIQSKANGLYTLQKAGYLRKTGAEIIRKAQPQKIEFYSKLFRVSRSKNNADVVISLSI